MADDQRVKNNTPNSGLYGLVLCGGNSSRMGTDKCMLVYADKPQYAAVNEILNLICGKVFLSVNTKQDNKFPEGYKTIIDQPCYNNIGPMAALLSAFAAYPANDFLIIGCDYPFLSGNDVYDFLLLCKSTPGAAAFYNRKSDLYEPLLAYYNHKSATKLLEMYANKEYSLQHFLRTINATKFYPSNEKCMTSIDTKEDYLEAHKLVKI